MSAYLCLRKLLTEGSSGKASLVDHTLLWIWTELEAGTEVTLILVNLRLHRLSWYTYLLQEYIISPLQSFHQATWKREVLFLAQASQVPKQVLRNARNKGNVFKSWPEYAKKLGNRWGRSARPGRAGWSTATELLLQHTESMG